ncbi:MAG: glycosyltransferase [Actinomycetales bacterium]|nr:glycosyltransferase [Actinomycetales bacterium]
MYALMLRRAGKVIWDFDDDIVASREIGSREFYLLCGASDIIVVTHTELRRVLPAAAAAKAITLSTTDGDFRGTDFNAVLEDRRATLKEEFRIVWVATSASISDLISVAEALDKAAGQVKASCGKRVVLEVVCNVPLVYDFVTLHLVNSLWSRETAREALLKAHLGIMPLLDSQFARGKGGFKLVQYLAAGLPAIASRVGFNAVVVADGETGYLVSPGDERGWVEAIAEVACHEANWAKLSYASLLRFRDSPFPMRRICASGWTRFPRNVVRVESSRRGGEGRLNDWQGTPSRLLGRRGAGVSRPLFRRPGLLADPGGQFVIVCWPNVHTCEHAEYRLSRRILGHRSYDPSGGVQALSATDQSFDALCNYMADSCAPDEHGCTADASHEP